MKTTYTMAICALAFVNLSYASTPPSEVGPSDSPVVSTAHYHDLHGNSLEAFEPIWQTLADFMGTTTPDEITVTYGGGPQSMFNPDFDRILVQIPGSERLVAHETAHLFICHMTQFASLEEQHRFIDEGLASVLGNKISGSLEHYRKDSHNIAVDQLELGQLTLDQLQKWKTYRAEQGPWKAYNVASNFVLYVLDTYGRDKLIELLGDLAESRDLGVSSEAVLGATLDVVFADWLETLKTTPKFALPDEPAVLEASPAHGSVDVSTDLEEISVTFNTFMFFDICAQTECGDSGICHEHARWESHQRLVIPVVGGLRPNHRYQIGLGSADGCLFKSSSGVEMPVTEWEFVTGP